MQGAEKRRNIQRKVVTSILLVGTIPGIIVVILTYLSGINALKNSIGANFQEMAKETADKIQIILNNEINYAKSLALSPYIKDAVSKANQSSEGKKDTEIQKRPRETRQRRAFVKDGGALGSKITNNKLSEYLKEYKRQYGSLFITDKRGAIIAATNRPADYLQGKERWWQATFNQGKGREFISGIDYDEDAQTFSVAIAVPIMDKDNKRAIGVLKIIHDVNDIFKAITNIKIGETGHANFVTSDGVLIVCPVFPPKSHRINDRLMRQISADSPGWGIAADDAHGGKNSIIGFAPVISTLQMGPDNFGGKAWHIFVRQLPDETYAPMYALLWRVSFLGIGLIGVLFLLGFYAARRIVRPISLLKEGAELIGHGRLDHRINIKTSDEIEQLAETFNRMADNLEKSDMERDSYLKQIKESEGRYKTLFDHAEDSMMLVDLEGNLVAVNKRQEEVIGYSKDSLLGQKFSGILSKEDGETFTRLFEKTLCGEKPVTTEVKVFSKGGNLLIMEMDLTGVKGDGRIVNVQIHLRDITRRNILEKEIKLERDKLETIIESMGDGLDIVDKDFQIRFMNEKFLKIYGKESIGKTCYEVYTGLNNPCNECPVVKGIEKIGVLEVNTLQGQTFLITHSPLKNIDGTISILEIFKDITERKKLESAIKESEEQYKTLFDHTEDSILMLDLEGRPVAFNKRQEEVIGYSKDILLGQRFSALLSKEDKEIFGDLFIGTLAGEKPPTAEVGVLCRRGNVIRMDMDMTGIRRGDNIAFVQMHLRDLTKRKELEQQVLRSERLAALGHFASTLVHDLRNPIVGIKKRMEGLQITIGSSSPEETNRVLTDIISGSGLLLGMVNDVLDIYQNSYEDLPLIISAFPIVNAIEEAINLLQVEAEERKVSIALHDEYGSIDVRGDKRRLQRVFINLLDNAIKFSPAGGKVGINLKTVTEEGLDYLLLTVEDDGPGIPASEIANIFEPFHRNDRREDGKTGTGLGLYFCKVVVGLHSGKIWAENRKEKGAVFYIKIPVREGRCRLKS